METKDIKRGVLIGGAALGAAGSIYKLTQAADTKTKVIFGAAAIVCLWVLKKGVVDKAEGFFDALGIANPTKKGTKDIGGRRYVKGPQGRSKAGRCLTGIDIDGTCYKAID